MDFDLSDEQLMVADSARRLIADRSPADHLRALIDGGETIDRPLWEELGAQGFLGAALPEVFGGSGLGELELALVAEEVGRAAAALPLSSTIGLAAEALFRGGSDLQRAAWLPRLASGKALAAVAFAEGSTDCWSTLPSVRFDLGKVSGALWPVADLAAADLLIVACRAGDAIALALVDPGQAGVRRTPLVSLDPLRPVGRLDLDGAVGELLAPFDYQALLDRAAMLAAFEQVGGAAACLDMARAYCLERDIFGRPLAGFQAVKHRLADLYVAIELARSNAYYAAWAVAADAPERAEAVAVARLSALDAYAQAARENVQLHGGIGYTWEADCHFHYRRERFLALALGGRQRWADRLIAALTPRQEAA